VLRTRWDILLVISAGGALGSAARWSVADLLPAHPDQIPVATWLANVTGSLILGALMFLVVDVWGPTRYVRPFWGVGVLGGYTTFSTYMLDTRTLVASGAMLAAAVYVVGTVATGIPASWAGLAGTRAVVAAAARRRHTERDVDPDPPPATDAPRSTR
jgi:CrcB protein